MTSHHEEPPIEIEGAPPEEDLSTAEASDDLEESPEEKKNYTERHPEHFHHPPGHVRETREHDDADD